MLTRISTTMAACVLSGYWLAFLWNVVNSYPMA